MINFDGTLDHSVVLSDDIVISDIWFYIWYLWKNNKNEINEFKKMTSPIDSNAAYAEHFLFVVKARFDKDINEYLVSADLAPSQMHTSKQELFAFVDYIFKTYQNNVQLPELKILFTKLEMKLIQKEKNLITGLNQVSKKINAGNGITVSFVTSN